MKDRRQNYSTDYACIFGVFEQMKNQLIKLTDAFQIGKEISRMGNQIGSRDHHGKLIIQGRWLKIRGLVHVFQGGEYIHCGRFNDESYIFCHRTRL